MQPSGASRTTTYHILGIPSDDIWSVPIILRHVLKSLNLFPGFRLFNILLIALAPVSLERTVYGRDRC